MSDNTNTDYVDTLAHICYSFIASFYPIIAIVEKAPEKCEEKEINDQVIELMKNCQDKVDKLCAIFENEVKSHHSSSQTLPLVYL